jgi:AcrR family transcriptional regulator
MPVTDVAAAAVRGRPRSSEADLAIQRATIELLLDEGYEGLTMAGVAHRAGVSTATLYRRYQSKEDLVVGALTGMKDELDQTETGSLVDDIRALAFEGCATFEQEGGRLIKSLIGEVQRNPDLAAALRQQILDHRRDKARRMIEAAVDRGEIPPPADAEVALDMIAGPFIFRALVTGEPLDKRFAENLATLALRMLGAEPADPAEPAKAAGPARRRRR